MFDFSNLVGQKFVNNYQEDEVLTVHAAYFYEGTITLVLSREGSPLFTADISYVKQPRS